MSVIKGDGYTCIADTIVFTDMDGTLLDHHTYDISPALPMLAKLRQRNVPVIPTTSKTFAELIALREAYDLDGPFIVENGAAVYLPHKFFPQKVSGTVWTEGFWCKSLSSPRMYWLKIVERLKDEFAGEFIGFDDMSTEQIIDATGLKQEEAERAAKRQFGEPILFTGTEQRKNAFIETAKHRGANVLEGGRFMHICGDVDKGAALNWFASTYTQQFSLSQPPTTIALGDSGNDIAMLEQANIGIRILSPTRPPPEVNKTSGQLYTSTQYGPSGWNEMLERYFNNNI